MEDNTYDLKPADAGPTRLSRQPKATSHLVDRLCPRCAYNLRGIPKDHPCPECGVLTNFTDSFNDELQYGSPRWAARLAWGLGIFLVGFLLLPFQLLLRIAETPAWVIIGCAGLAGAMEFVGLWWFCSPEPAASQPERAWSVRRMLRCAAVLTAGCDVLMCAGLALQGSGIEYAVSLVTTFAYVAALVLRSCLLGLYLEVLARRIPDDALANRAITATWGLVLTSPTIIVGLGVSIGALSGPLAITSLLCSAAAMSPFLSFYVWTLQLLLGCVRDLRASAIEAAREQIPQR